jgi:hypothetical protein
MKTRIDAQLEGMKDYQEVTKACLGKMEATTETGQELREA